jgi:hypothetical protein
MFLPQILVRAGKEEEARSVVAGIEKAAGERYVSPLVKAFAHAALGEKDRSLSLLEEAEAERSVMFTLCVLCHGYLKLAPGWVLEWFAACRERIKPSEATLMSTPKPGNPDRS